MDEKEDRAFRGGGARRWRGLWGYALVAAVLALVVVLLLDNDRDAWEIAGAALIGLIIGDLVVFFMRRRRDAAPR